MNHILTILEASVSPDNWEALKQAYADVSRDDLPAAVLSSHLIQETATPEIWRIITIWENRAALDAYRASVETPVWILVFRAAQADPTLIVSEIVESK